MNNWSTHRRRTKKNKTMTTATTTTTTKENLILCIKPNNKPTELETLTHRMQKASHHPTATTIGLMNYSKEV